jgi:hypothetical protein
MTITARDQVAGITVGQVLSVNGRHGVLAGDNVSSGFPVTVSSVVVESTRTALSGGSAAIQGAYGTARMAAMSTPPIATSACPPMASSEILSI